MVNTEKNAALCSHEYRTQKYKGSATIIIADEIYGTQLWKE